MVMIGKEKWRGWTYLFYGEDMGFSVLPNPVSFSEKQHSLRLIEEGGRGNKSKYYMIEEGGEENKSKKRKICSLFFLIKPIGRLYIKKLKRSKLRKQINF